MGNMTDISILNDGFDQIKKNPKEFVSGIEKAIHAHRGDRTSFGVGNHANVCTAHPSHHADTAHLYLSHENMFFRLDEYGIEDYLRERGGYMQPSDDDLDFVEQRLASSIRMLREAKNYVEYLRTLPPEQRPGGSEYELLGDHHMKAHQKPRNI